MDWLIGHLIGDFLLQPHKIAREKKRHTLACAAHVSIYTASVALLTFWPWPALIVVWVTHFAQDRTDVIPRWMEFVGQREFALPPFYPWSIIFIDQCWHLVVLYLISRIVELS